MKKIFGLFMIITLFSLSAFADIARPKEEKQKDTDANIRIYLDDDAKEAKLVISRELINKLANQEIAANSSQNYGLGFSRTQTIVSGLFLSLALVFGGVWFSRSKNLGKTANIAMGIGIFAMLGVFGTIAFANVAPPTYGKLTGKVFSEGMQNQRVAYGQIKIEIDEEGSPDRILLVVPNEKKPAKPNKNE